MANAKRKKPKKPKPAPTLRTYDKRNSPAAPRTITTMRLPNDLLAALGAEAKARQRSRSSLIEEVLYDYIRPRRARLSVFD